MKSIAKKYDQSNFAEQEVSTGSIENNQDPRRYPCRTFQKSIFFNYEDQKYKGVIKNASRGGVFIETRAKFLFGQTIELVIPNSHIHKARRVRAWMVHSSQKGIGVTFKRLFERRSGKERRHAIDRRIGLDRRKRPKPKNRNREMNLLTPGIRL
jgi:Tfp pilus assembly protein PilZ